MKAENCPWARLNRDYPYEGMVTEHACILKPCGGGVICDGETPKGCPLLKAMTERPELLEQQQEWCKTLAPEYFQPMSISP